MRSFFPIIVNNEKVKKTKTSFPLFSVSAKILCQHPWYCDARSQFLPNYFFPALCLACICTYRMIARLYPTLRPAALFVPPPPTVVVSA
mmetsp:Transcript_11099/g.24500  ORF Transcript_11099/g.24500 Transcript_11099/m.24500 type:complete len:89 (-) Transcript_11099:583-849(-)